MVDPIHQQSSDNRAITVQLKSIAEWPPVVKQSNDRRYVHEAMKPLPSLAAQTPNHSGCGRQREGSHDQESSEANCEERMFHNVGAAGPDEIPNGGPRDHPSPEVESCESIEDDVREKVQSSVEEGEEAQHATKPDRRVPLRQLPQRGHGQGEIEKSERPYAGFPDGTLERVPP